MRMRRLFIVCGMAVLAGSARAQAVPGACDPLLSSGARQAARTFGDLQVCMVAAPIDAEQDGFPSDWIARATTVMLETRRPNDVRRYLLDPSRLAWTVNDRPVPMDSIAEAWQKAVLTVLDYAYEAEAVRSQSAALIRQIDSLPARGAAAAAQIKALDKQLHDIDVSVMDIRRREYDLRTSVSNLERQRAGAERQANAASMRAASATDPRAKQAAEAAARSADASLARAENDLRNAEHQLEGFDSERMISDLQDRRSATDASRKLAVLRLDLANADAKTFSRELSQLDAAQRLAALDARVETARQALVAILEARGKAPSR
jgi:hypothetical protein